MDNHFMKALICAVFLLIGKAIYAQYMIPKLDWIYSLSNTNNANGAGITLDNDGNVIFTGYFNYTVDFDPGPGIVNLSSSGSADIFVTKYSNDGTFLWAVKMGGSGSDKGSGITVDQYNNIIVTGSFHNTADFDPGPAVASHVCNSSYGNAFIVKLDPQGNYIWSNTLTSNYGTVATTVATDTFNNVYAVGSFDVTTDIDPGADTMMVVSQGSNDIYILKLDQGGNYLNSYVNGASGFDQASKIFIDESNNVFIAGRYQDTVDFDPGTGVSELIGPAGINGFVMKLDQNFNFLWVRAPQSQYASYCGSVTKNQFGQVYITGYFSGLTDFDTGPGTNMINSNGDNDVYIIRLDENGDYIWARTFGGSGGESSYGIASDTLGNAYIIGRYYGTADFDPGPGTEIHTSFGTTSGYADMFVEKFDSLGNMVWTFTAGNSTSTNTMADIVVDESSRVYMSGSNGGVIDWAPGPEQVLINSPGVDAFVMVWDQCVPAISIDSVDACNSYVWLDGNNHTSSDSTSTFTILNGGANGCDSIVKLYLTINYSSTTTDVQTACGSYTWIDGNTYSASTNTPIWVLTNSSGCDSIVILNLTIPVSIGIDEVYACGSYTWIDGNTYTSSTNTPTYTLTSSSGCDSIVTLNLQIGSTSTTTDVVTACDSYTWIDGNTYTSSNNSATWILQNIYGCDSTITLDLTITNSNSVTQAISSCESYTWLNGVTYTSSIAGPTWLLTNSAGCDSLVMLDLTINYPTSSTDIVLTCDSLLWIDGNVYSSDIYGPTWTLSDINGCDSIVTLDLSLMEIDTTISVLDPFTLQANQMGASYQWLDCDSNYTAIPGATWQLLIATYSGNFACEVTYNNCTDTTACITITEAGLTNLPGMKKDLVKIIDTMGREINFTYGMPMIYIYSDGTHERVMVFEL